MAFLNLLQIFHQHLIMPFHFLHRLPSDGPRQLLPPIWGVLVIDGQSILKLLVLLCCPNWAWGHCNKITKRQYDFGNEKFNVILWYRAMRMLYPLYTSGGGESVCVCVCVSCRLYTLLLMLAVAFWAYNSGTNS